MCQCATRAQSDKTLARPASYPDAYNSACCCVLFWRSALWTIGDWEPDCNIALDVKCLAKAFFLPISTSWYFLLVIVTFVAPFGTVKIMLSQIFELGVPVYTPELFPIWLQKWENIFSIFILINYIYELSEQGVLFRLRNHFNSSIF